ncbi:MAG: sensor histidine kinase [Pirellulaceae bacterium]
MNYPGVHSRLRVFLPSAVASSMLTVAWLVQPAMLVEWPWRAAVVAFCLGVWFLLSRWESGQRVAMDKVARRYLEVLCQFSHHDLSNEQVVDTLPVLPRSHPWQEALQRVRERLVECGNRADTAEHAATSAEVRLRRLENENQRMRDMLDRIPEPIVAINSYDELVWANGPARQMFAIESPGDHVAKVHSAIHSTALVQLLTDTRRRRGEVQRVGELSVVDKTGQQRWFRTVCRTLPEDSAESGKHGAVGILVDISQEKSIQKRHAEFVAAAAHEMKTPLSSIRAYVELLQDGEVDDVATQEEFWHVIQTQAERLQRLIENLLNLARIEAGVIKVDKRTHSLNEILERAMVVVQPAAEQKSLKYVRDLSPMYLGVLCDRDHILQAAINLLSNAVKYTPEGGTVVLRSRMNDEAVEFEVEDSGVGLSPTDCQRVFEKFYRVEKNQQMAPGTGLGLPLAKHIVEDVHGGSLHVTSQEGVGSVFRVTLPAGGHGAG